MTGVQLCYEYLINGREEIIQVHGLNQNWSQLYFLIHIFIYSILDFYDLIRSFGWSNLFFSFLCSHPNQSMTVTVAATVT